jgi:hypothetical protein
MIKIFGDSNTSEYAAACQLQEIIKTAWPDVALESSQHKVWLIAGKKCFGLPVKDVDLLLLAEFTPVKYFKPFSLFSYQYSNGDVGQIRPDQIEVTSLCVAIEVKNHSLANIRIEGNEVLVDYNEGGWKSATEQNFKQVYAIKNYANINRVTLPRRIRNLVWLRNVTNVQLSNLPVSNVIGANVTWTGFLMKLCETEYPWYDYKTKTWYLDNDRSGIIEGLADLFTKTISLDTTPLDHRKLSLMLQQSVDNEAVLETLGKRLQIIQGFGGVGKTMRLLQLAYELSQNRDKNVLILTYNRALVADLRRLLTISGMSMARLELNLNIQTVHSFFFAVFKELSILDTQEKDFLSNYQQYKAEALAYFESKVITATDLEQRRQAGHPSFNWDYIFIDEGQDWPTDEPKLLFKLYPPQSFVVADGGWQLIRTYEPTTWRNLLPKPQRSIEILKVCMRMKAGLTRFVIDLIGNLGIGVENWQANDELGGGQVIIIEHDYLADSALHDRLIARNAKDNNKPIDMLFCVSPALAHPKNNHVSSVTQFEEWGQKVWDGTNGDDRDSFPLSADQLRVVQYDSCRGLEGWVVVNLDLDGFYDHKRNIYLTNPPSMHDSPQDIEAEAHQFAARWLIIPLTRAIDTLVIHLSGQVSPLRTALERTSQKWQDIVEWHKG